MTYENYFSLKKEFSTVDAINYLMENNKVPYINDTTYKKMIGRIL